MYKIRATTVTYNSLRNLIKVCRQTHHFESIKVVTFYRNLSTATQISEVNNYNNSRKSENYNDFQQNPDGVSNSLSKPSWQGQKDWIFRENFRTEQSPNGVYQQQPRTEYQEPSSGTSSYFSKDSKGFQHNPPGQNENFSSGRVEISSKNEFRLNPHAQNENFSSGRVDFSSRNEFQQTIWQNGILSPSSNDFGSNKKYQSNLVEHNRNDNGYRSENASNSLHKSRFEGGVQTNGYQGENSSNLLHKSSFEGGVQAQPGQNGVYGHYQQNLNGYTGGNIGLPQQNLPNYNPGNSGYPQSSTGFNMEKHSSSSVYSREMMGKYPENLSGVNPSSTGHQFSYQSQNGIVGHQEMRSSTPMEQPSDSADSSNIKGSVDELDSFCKEGKLKEAVEVLSLLEQQHVTVDLPRYIALMDACGEDQSLEEAKSVHEHLVKSHPHLDVKMYNKILEMYGRCGSMDDALLVFRKMPQRNLTSWDTMITWLGKNGLGEDAIELFAEFKKTAMKPDGQMFLGVFHACSVVGDIVEGMLHFESMNKDYGIVHSMEHYVGVVDMLGSTGYLDEALDFIEKMPMEPSIEVWETMMNLCRIHGNLELGDRCAEIVELLDPSRLDEQSKAGYLPVKVSDIAKEKEKKKFAQSLLEARSRVHEYRAGDRSHPGHEKIYELLRGLKQLMKEDGYIPETKFVLHDVDQETKEDALMAHSERLAFAQGLMNSSVRSPIRIIKNLRVCGDCHNALKIASRLVGREIIMRDAKRFHHLKDGLCSCKDYW